jgi:integral membrane protein
MAAMTSILSGQRNGAKVAGWFRLVALAEAFSWVGLLVGMYFKYLGAPQTEVGVKIFGPLHGGVFVAFLVVALLAGVVFKWGVVTWLLALLGSIVPLGSVIFVMWADRTGRLGVKGGLPTSPTPAEAT